MAVDDIQDLLVHALADHNPWWRDPTALEGVLPGREKSDFYHFVRPGEDTTLFEELQLTGIVGQHGVGKTTLLKQFIHHQIGEGVPPERFLFIPFDANALYQLQSPEQLRRALQYYESRILGRLEEQTPHFVVLDDVHRVIHDDKPAIADWSPVVREALTGEPGRHVVVTAGAVDHVGDQLDRLGIDTNESVVQPILPEKFRDYIFTRYPDLEDGETRVSPTPLRAGEGSLPQALDRGRPDALVETVREQHQRVESVSRRLQSQVVHYLSLGGILGYVTDDSQVDATTVDDDTYQRLHRNLTATLYQDAPSLDAIRTVADLERLVALAAHVRGTESIRFQRLVDLFDVDRRTIRDSYLSVLEKLFILTGITEYDNQRPRAVKLYPRDTGLVSALTGAEPGRALDDLSYESELARVAAFDHTMRLAYGINAARGTAHSPTVSYWRGREETVDFVFEVGDTPVPVALAYRSSERDSKVTALTEFTDTFDTPLGIVVVGESRRDDPPVRELQNGVVKLPYWLYLMLC